MKLSIVSTMYQSATYIQEFYDRISARIKQITNDYEIIFVNDGSPDNSLEIAVNIHKKDKKVVVVDLSRNFGHHKAMMTGLEQATGEFVFLIDIDLEEEPELLTSFWSDLQDKKDVDVIFGVQESRKGGLFERWSGALYYRFLNLVFNLKHPRNISTIRLMTKRYVKALLLHKERETVLSPLWMITGFNQLEKSITKKSSSPSTYSLYRKLKISIDAITSFSNRPLVGIFLIGTVISTIALIYSIHILIRKLLFSSPIDGWTSIIVSLWLLGGIIICFIGIVGLYLAKIFIEVKQRPYTIIKEIYREQEN